MNVTSKIGHSGFTLVEMVIGIVVMAIAMTMLSTVFFANPERSVAPLLQIRAAVFGQAIMDEILGKAFDETSPIGGVPACTVCTPSANFGSDSETRITFNDVDDYNDYCNTSNPGTLIDAEGNVPDNYEQFSMSICVEYDGNFDGVGDSDVNAKLIKVDIFPPTGAGLSNPITFTAYKGNF